MKLQTHDECEAAVKNGTATALQIFIYENEPAGKEPEELFRKELSNLIDEHCKLDKAVIEDAFTKAIEWHESIVTKDISLLVNETAQTLQEVKDAFFVKYGFIKSEKVEA
jgi:hypothetical protein